MSHDHDDTPPDHDCPRWAVRLEKQIAAMEFKLESLSERSYRHIGELGAGVSRLHDAILGITPRLAAVEADTAEVKARSLAHADRIANWKGIASGIVLVLGAGAVMTGIVLAVLQLTK